MEEFGFEKLRLSVVVRLQAHNPVEWVTVVSANHLAGQGSKVSWRVRRDDDEKREGADAVSTRITR
jgi:hypothetical protein